jgi:hypothetical protein
MELYLKSDAAILFDDILSVIYSDKLTQLMVSTNHMSSLKDVLDKGTDKRKTSKSILWRGEK